MSILYNIFVIGDRLITKASNERTMLLYFQMITGKKCIFSRSETKDIMIN